MRTSRTGWIVVALFIAGGAAFWVLAPELWIGQIWVGIAVLVAIALAFISRKYDSAGAYQAWSQTQGAQMMTGALPTQETGTSSTQVSVGTPMQVAPGSDVGAAVLAALKQHGIDPTAGGTVDLRNGSAARDAVLNALKTHGIDVAHQVAVAAPSVPIQAGGAPVEAMAKLQQLRDSGLITPEDFEQYKKGVLGAL
jgi:hypothetical protein